MYPTTHVPNQAITSSLRFELEPNLRLPIEGFEWCAEVEARHFIVNHSCCIFIGSVTNVWHHSHGIWHCIFCRHMLCHYAARELSNHDP